MQTSLPAVQPQAAWQQRLPWLLPPLFAILLWTPEIKTLWGSWRGDPSLSHGPLVPLVVIGMLWMLRGQLRQWSQADPRGLVGMLLTALLYVFAVWADIDFLKPLSLIALMLSCIWFVGGSKNLLTCLGPLGFLVFMIPWPTTLVDHLAFPLQLASSAYAA